MCTFSFQHLGEARCGRDRWPSRITLFVRRLGCDVVGTIKLSLDQAGTQLLDVSSAAKGQLLHFTNVRCSVSTAPCFFAFCIGLAQS